MKKLFALVLALAMVLSLVACGSQGSTGDDATGDDGAVKDSIVIQIPEEPATLDPVTNHAMVVAYLVDQIYGKLFDYDDKGVPACELAASYEPNENFDEWTIVLRDDIKFSDGSPITSADVAYSLNYAVAANNNYVNNITGVETPDEKTVVLKLAAACSSEPNNLCSFGCVIFPEGSHEATDIAKGATAYSGPYMLDAWNLGKNIVLKANPEWFDADSVSIKTVTYKFIGDESNALVALEAGEVDMLTAEGTLTATACETIEGIENAELVPVNSANAVLLVPNYAMEELSDVNVRQAINWAIDRVAIQKVSDLGEVCGNYFAPDYFGTDYVPGHDAPVQDIEKAKEYMAKSNYPNGFEMSMQVPTEYVKAATVIQEELSALNIKVSVDEVDGSTWIDNLLNGNYEFGIVTYSNVLNNMAGFVAMHEVGGSLGMNNNQDSTIYDMLQEGFTKGGEERNAIMTQVADICEEEVPYLCLYMMSTNYARNAALHVETPTASGYNVATMHW